MKIKNLIGNKTNQLEKAGFLNDDFAPQTVEPSVSNSVKDNKSRLVVPVKFKTANGVEFVTKKSFTFGEIGLSLALNPKQPNPFEAEYLITGDQLTSKDGKELIVKPKLKMACLDGMPVFG